MQLLPLIRYVCKSIHFAILKFFILADFEQKILAENREKIGKIDQIFFAQNRPK